MSDTKALASRIEYMAKQNASLLERAGYTQDQWAKVAINALVFNPAIADCDQRSIDQAYIRCMNAGLTPDGQEAAIVPFRKTATLIPMVEGRLKLARNATPGIGIRAMAVFDGDVWEYEEGLRPILRHVPQGVNEHPDAIIYTYAVATFPNGTTEHDVMSRSTIDRYRAMSLSRNGGPWDSHFEEMAKNAVLKRLLKRLPKSAADIDRLPPELERVDTLDDLPGIIDAEDVTVVDHGTGEIIDVSANEQEPDPQIPADIESLRQRQHAAAPSRSRRQQPEPPPPIDEPEMFEGDDDSPF